jgi:predicted NodU family carbamoyl transferase
VLGWFQGRMEWGPRALGNRSIIGDPRRADMKDILNRKIKRRESFRPFAPVILNTSFNENEPVVCTPQEALNCFLRTKMDVLVLGDYFVRRDQ